MRLLYAGHVEVIGDSAYARVLSLLNFYDVEHKGRKLREKEAMRSLRVAGELAADSRGKLKSVYSLKLPTIGMNFQASKNDPMPYVDVVFRMGGDTLRSSRGFSASPMDFSEINADKTYLANLKNKTVATAKASSSEKPKQPFFVGHKAILCARCKYFNSLTIQDTFTIYFDDQMDKDVFKIFLHFIYSVPSDDAPNRLQNQLDLAIKKKNDRIFKRGGVALQEDQTREQMLFTLLTVSGKYGLDDLKIQCEYLLLQRLSSENVFKVFQCACSTGANQLKQVTHQLCVFTNRPKVCVEMIVSSLQSSLLADSHMEVEGGNKIPSLLSTLSMDAAEELFNYVDSKRSVHFGMTTPSSALNPTYIRHTLMSPAKQERTMTLAATESLEGLLK